MVDILLASYNGEKYIAEQIESIINQTFEDWFLYIKDDCSSDGTLDIVNEYETKYKDKIKVIKSDKPSGSAKNNFFSLLQYSKSDYVMTCDQDDIWLPEKIELAYKKMMETENEYENIPILIHSDLKVVDENLNIISNSLFKLQNLDSTRDKINNLLVQNIVTGCTVMVNRKLLSYTTNIPEKAVMHDWWMALIASCLGKIVFIETPTILYRQHDLNSVGAKDVRSGSYIMNKLSNIESINDSLRETYFQAEELLKLLNNVNCVKVKDYNKIKQYSLFVKYSKFIKIIILIRCGLWKNSITRIAGQILFC